MNHPNFSLERFQHIVFFTGAGLSAESGLPTYRGKGGIWGSYDWKEYACQQAFDQDPAKVWTFHDERRRLMAKAEPSGSHRIIAAVQRAHRNTQVVTQNIDGLHQRAGSSEVIELHGSVWRVRCDCSGPAKEILEVPIPSHGCPNCGAWRRPDIVWFADPMQPAPIHAAIDAMAACDLLVSIGTSGVVFPAAELPRLAQQNGALCVEINPEETPVSGQYSVHFRTPASEALATIWPAVSSSTKQ